MFNKNGKLFHTLLIMAICISLGSLLENLNAASVGQTLSNAQIKNSSDKLIWIPEFGKKVLTIFYVDLDNSDAQDPVADAINAKKYDEKYYKGIGIANLEDTKGPNFIIRRIIKSKEEKYDTTIHNDDDYLLKKAWNLGDCNGVSVVIVIGKDKKIKFIKKLNKKSQASAAVSEVIKIIENEIAKTK